MLQLDCLFLNECAVPKKIHDARNASCFILSKLKSNNFSCEVCIIELSTHTFIASYGNLIYVTCRVHENFSFLLIEAIYEFRKCEQQKFVSIRTTNMRTKSYAGIILLRIVHTKSTWNSRVDRR